MGHDDPHTAIVTFSEAYASWRELFGGLDGILPAHAFDGETDISGQWNDSIPISGGPWRQESWSQEQHILVPNENYWVPERVPQVDRVVMVPREDTDTRDRGPPGPARSWAPSPSRSRAPRSAWLRR